VQLRARAGVVGRYMIGRHSGRHGTRGATTRAQGKEGSQNRKLRPLPSDEEGAGMKAGAHTQHRARHKTHALEGRLAPPTSA
jgi:hypothetical protein